MARALPLDEMVRIAYAAGFRGDALVTAVAVAMGESGGNPQAHNPNANTGDNSYGLWQVNMLGSMGPARRKQFGLTSNEELWDPIKNAKAAYAISGGGKNFKPWTIFTKGAYQKFVPQVRAAVQRLGHDPGQPTGGYAPDVAAATRTTTRAGATIEPGQVRVQALAQGGFTADEIRSIYREFAGMDPDDALVSRLTSITDPAQVASEIQTTPEAKVHRLGQFTSALKQSTARKLEEER